MYIIMVLVVFGFITNTYLKNRINSEKYENSSTFVFFKALLFYFLFSLFCIAINVFELFFALAIVFYFIAINKKDIIKSIEKKYK